MKYRDMPYGVRRMQALANEWERNKTVSHMSKNVWPAFERAARKWAQSEGLDEDEFVEWLKRKASEVGDIVQTQIPRRASPTHAATIASVLEEDKERS